MAFGNSFNDEERCLLAGYDNGDVKLFDLRMNQACLGRPQDKELVFSQVRWETHVPNAVCGVQFDRPDIRMNKFAVACLESQLHVFDARTRHPQEVTDASLVVLATSLSGIGPVNSDYGFQEHVLVRSTSTPKPRDLDGHTRRRHRGSVQIPVPAETDAKGKRSRWDVSLIH